MLEYSLVVYALIFILGAVVFIPPRWSWHRRLANWLKKTAGKITDPVSHSRACPHCGSTPVTPAQPSRRATDTVDDRWSDAVRERIRDLPLPPPAGLKASHSR